MKGIHLHIHIHHHDEINDSLTIKLDKIMSKLDDIKQEIAEIKDSAANISADLDRISEQIAGGLTPSEADGVIAELATISDNLKALADRNPDGSSTTTSTTTL